MGSELEMPLQFPGVRVQGQQAVRIEVVSGTSASVIIRSRISRSPKQGVELGIVGSRNPGGSTAVHVCLSGPALTAFLTRPRNCPKAPLLLTGLRIERSQETADPVVAARGADHYLIFDDQRSAGCPVVSVADGIRNIPYEPA